MGAILTVQEVAQRMRCEHRTVRRAIRSGELEVALIGGKWLVREEAVDDWFRSRCASPNPFSQSQRRTPRAGQGDPTAPLVASNDCRRWREEADERSQAWQAVRDLRDARSTSPRRKTGRARDVDLIAPLAQDLAEWRMACGRPPDGELVIPRP